MLNLAPLLTPCNVKIECGLPSVIQATLTEKAETFKCDWWVFVVWNAFTIGFILKYLICLCNEAASDPFLMEILWILIFLLKCQIWGNLDTFCLHGIVHSFKRPALQFVFTVMFRWEKPTNLLRVSAVIFF